MGRQRAGSVIFLLTGLYGFTFSIQLPMGKWNEPGPGIFPLFFSFLLLLSGVLSLLGRAGAEPGLGGIRAAALPVWIIALTLGYILLLERAGYLITSGLYLFVLFYGVSRYRIGVALALALALASGSLFFFGRILGVQLPPGWLGL